MHKTPIKIYYEDTDCGGVVYYANYLKYFERGRTEHLEKRGISLAKLQKRGTLFTVVNASLEYKAPAQYGDSLIVETSIEKLRAASFVVLYKIVRESDGTLLVIGVTKMACVNDKMKPQELPPEVRDALTRG